MSGPLSKLSNLQQRVIVGLLGIGLFVGLLFLGWMGAVFLFTTILALSLFEFYGLSPFSMSFGWRLGGSALGVLIFLFLLLANMQESASFYRILFLLSPLLLIVLVFAQPQMPFQVLSWLVFGWFYLISPWYCLLMLVGDFQFNPGLILGIFGLLWAADSGAYFVGRKLGKTKLFPAVSPKKSWEGLAGGLISAGILAYVLSVYVGVFSQNQWLVLAATTTIFGTLGDLAESTLKRSLSLKDSGHLLPGHGGILDRFDGWFVASPLNYLVAIYFF